MVTSTENVDLYSFYTTKITRWKGNYPRILSIGTHGLATYNTTDCERTNYWQWTDLFSLSPNSTSDHPNQLQLTHRKGKSGQDSMRFESDQRSSILTYALTNCKLFARGIFSEQIERVENCFGSVGKFCHGSSTTTTSIKLRILPYAIEQTKKENSNNLKKNYYLKDIDSVIEFDDGGSGGGFAIKMMNTERLHTYSATPTDRSQIISKIIENASHFIGHSICLVRSEESLHEILKKRLGKYASDVNLISLAEFQVQNGLKNRILICLSESCFLERELGGYLITTLHPLQSIYALIRCNSDSQELIIEFNNGESKSYFSTERDALLASLLDGIRAAGNTAVCVKSRRTNLGLRWGSLGEAVDEKVESIFLKFLHQPPPSWSWLELLDRFNANIEYSGLVHSSSSNGLFSENKEKLILVALNALITTTPNQNNNLEPLLHTFRRLLTSKTGFSAFSEMPALREKLGLIVTGILRAPNSPILNIHAALETISALMQPMHCDSDLRIEQENKEKVLSSGRFLESLLEVWEGGVKRGTGALVTMALLDILTFALCAPYSETTLGNQFDSLLAAVAGRAGVLFSLFQQESCVAIVKGSGLIMKALIEEGQGQIAAEIQDMALKEGALIRHLINALFVNGTADPRLLTLRQLSRHLVTLWTSGHDESLDLLRRVFPPGLLNLLSSSSTATSPTDDDNEEQEQQETDYINSRDTLALANNQTKAQSNLQKNVRVVEKFVEKRIESTLKHWRLNSANEARRMAQFRPVALRKRRQNLKTTHNWPLFFKSFPSNFLLPNLIWNFQTREELRCALTTEIRLLDSDREHISRLGREICWNYQDFTVNYKSISDEIQIGGYYLRLLIEAGGEIVIGSCREFFNDLYHRFLLSGRVELRGVCLQAMALVYAKNYNEIGPFNDLKFIVMMLEKTTEIIERDRIVIFLLSLMNHHANARELTNSGGLKVLVDLMTLAHLHTNRASHGSLGPLQTNVIEAGNIERSDSKEWYYMDNSGSAGVKIGPVGFSELKSAYKSQKINQKTKLWASGLDQWRPLSQIPQTKWHIIAHPSSSTTTTTPTPPLSNDSNLASTILEILIKVISYCPARCTKSNAIIRPVHKAKQILSDSNGCFPHIVQILLTFDPEIVERVAKLLCLLLEENPLASRVYQSGVYFFILMYRGGNVKWISEFLYLTHLSQVTFSSANNKSEANQKSILSPLLPSAMISYLKNHGVEKFSEIFLGEFDTPEAIWSSSMRRYLCERIALHLSDFSPRLLSNSRALYEYISIPLIEYEGLRDELFCDLFYLRNLTDEGRFPTWPISSPLNLLRSVLQAWKEELNKPPPPMTITEALQQLQLEINDLNSPEKIKKQYRKLAQLYHPDKNPAGREIFESANKSYEFLCSSNFTESKLGIDSNKIRLILRAQVILFKRFGEVLGEYKYSGYPLLISCIKSEVEDSGLFGRQDSLLEICIEVLYFTLFWSNENVEELRREGGLTLLLQSLDRCVSILPSYSKQPLTTPPLVILHTLRCFTVATQYQLCRDKLVEMNNLAENICRVFAFDELVELNNAAAECIAAMAVDTILQMQLIQNGAIWLLILGVLGWEGSVETSKSIITTPTQNKQLQKNIFSANCALALRALCGITTPTLTTPPNDVSRSCLNSLLLPHGLKLLLQNDSSPTPFLTQITSNQSTPAFIWNNKTRFELKEFCKLKLKTLKDEDFDYGFEFKYEEHANELIIGNVFVRVFNENCGGSSAGGAVLDGEEIEIFTEGIISFITEKNEENDQVFLALANVLKLGIETVFEKFEKKLEIFYHYLNKPSEELLDVLKLLFQKQKLTEDFNFLPKLLLLTLEDKEEIIKIKSLESVNLLLNNTNQVKNCLKNGTIIYLLNIFSSNNNRELRTNAVSSLSKIANDKLSGPRGKIIINKLIPQIFIDAFIENSPSSLNIYDNNTENPELLWNGEMRILLRTVIDEEIGELVKKHQNNDFSDYCKEVNVNYGLKEKQIGGIFLRIYVKNPAWSVRKPREFFKELLDALFSLSSNDDEELITKSLNILLLNNSNLADALISMGYVEKIISGLNSKNELTKKSSGIVFVFLSKSFLCSENLTSFKSIEKIKIALDGEKNVCVLAEGIDFLFSHGISELVLQAIESGLVGVMLSFLKGRDEGILRGGGGEERSELIYVLYFV